MSITIREIFRQTRQKKKGVFIPYFIMGYPDLETSYQIIKESSPYSDIIELGIPFSDPIADGPTIQKGVTHALAQDISLSKIFEMTKKLTQEIQKPFVYMIYFNQIIALGISSFLEKLKEIGVKGIIVPDLLPDSEPDFNKVALENNIDVIYLMTPTTNKQRISLLLRESHGFLYYVSVIGITGERQELNDEIEHRVEEIKRMTDLPICVGFGISTSEHVQSIVQFADGVIVGSAIVNKITENLGSPNLVPSVKKMVQQLSAVLL